MKTKLDQFISRNQKRNSHLYQAGLTVGYDFVVCPISNQRLSMIKDNYITNVLQMSLDQYPSTQRICNKRKENIKLGLQIIDATTGLTKYEAGQEKARAVLSQLDCAGVSGYAKKGRKTRATHMANIDEMGRNGYSQLASKAIIVGNSTKAKNGLITDPTIRPEFYRYKAVITYLTEKHRRNLTHGYVTGLAGKEGAHHIDHRYSILTGYKNKISPLVIGHLQNLKMIPWRDNVSKHTKCNVTMEQLLVNTGYSIEQSNAEFELVISLIQQDLADGIPVSGIRILEKIYESTIPR
jgi:hypothetical protein